MNRSPYIVGRGYDWAFFLLPPVAALLLGVVISVTSLSGERVIIAGDSLSIVTVLLGILIHTHLVAVFVRSHGNPAIFSRFPIRFTLVPLALWLAIVASAWIAVAVSVLATFWDVWHSGAQTFGFVRIYERNHGNDPERCRRLDFWLNQLLYAGPILAGATLMTHVESFSSFESVGDAVFSSVPAHVEGVRLYLTWAVLAAGTTFLCYYLYVHWSLHQRGHRVSPMKIWLLVSTGACSIYTWGFNSWGEAFFIMNVFHAVQYLALVWATEGERIRERLRVAGRKLAVVVFLGAVFAYGSAAQLIDTDIETLWAITLVVSIMHFWYDGFIWSVRTREV